MKFRVYGRYGPGVGADAPCLGLLVRIFHFELVLSIKEIVILNFLVSERDNFKMETQSHRHMQSYLFNLRRLFYFMFTLL